MARSGGIIQDFQKFLMQGNVIDLAVAVIIGGAFGKIIESLVADIITPAILNPVLTALKLDDIKQLSLNGIKYGVFLSAVLNFLVIAFCIFLLIRAFEKSKKRFSREQAAEAAAAPDPLLVSQERLADSMNRLAGVMERR